MVTLRNEIKAIPSACEIKIRHSPLQNGVSIGMRVSEGMERPALRRMLLPRKMPAVWGLAFPATGKGAFRRHLTGLDMHDGISRFPGSLRPRQ